MGTNNEDVVTSLCISNISITSLSHVTITEYDGCYIGYAGYIDKVSNRISWVPKVASHAPLLVAATMAIIIWGNVLDKEPGINDSVYRNNRTAIVNERYKDVW